MFDILYLLIELTVLILLELLLVGFKIFSQAIEVTLQVLNALLQKYIFSVEIPDFLSQVLHLHGEVLFGGNLQSRLAVDAYGLDVPDGQSYEFSVFVYSSVKLVPVVQLCTQLQYEHTVV